jgi:hypothetical protein
MWPSDSVESIVVTDNQSTIIPSSSTVPSDLSSTSTTVPVPSTSTSSTSVSATVSATPVNNDPVALMNQNMAKFNAENPINPKAESSLRSFNRFDVLDKLDQNNNLNRPDSPTGSTDSTETITPSTSLPREGGTRSRVRSISNLFSRNNK